MAEFFNYQSPYRTDIWLKLNNVEWLLPIFLVIVGAVLIFIFRNKFTDNPKLDKRFRIIVGIFFAIIYLSHYAFRFYLYQFDYIVLPFQLCSISMFLAIILIFTKNRIIFNFVLFTGVAGGLLSLFIPVLGYDSSYYRYYQYMIAHGILILTPIYFMAVHGYIPSAKETIYSFLVLEGIAIFMIIFNYYNGTDFLFLFIDEAKINKFPVIKSFGGIPLYLLWAHMTGIFYYFISYKAINFFYKRSNNN